jgi:RHS repeat-associated protein
LPTDPATGLNLLGARQYDPSLGAFLQLDPVLESGDPGQIGGYTYAGSDPVNVSDPTGLFFGPIVLAPPAHFTSHAKNKKSKTKPRKKKNQSWWEDPVGTAGNAVGAAGNALGSAGNAAWDAGTSTVNTLDPYARSLGRHLPSIVEGTTSLAGGGFAIFKGFGTAVGGCTAGAATGPGELVICTAAIAEGGTEIAIGTKRATDGIRKLGDDIQEINTEVNAGDRVIGPPDAPARFVVTPSGKVVDRAAVATRISRQRQERHIKGDPKRKERSYFRKLEEAQDVLDSFHDGTAEVIGVKGSDVVVRNTRVTGYNNNPQSGYADQPTHVFFIKGTRSPSVVPYNPNWRP